jgi:plastocyanin
MPRTLVATAAVACLVGLAPSAARAALTVEVVDAASSALADAVVYVTPASGRLPPHGPLTAIVDQVNRQFTPKVAVVQTGTSISFPNKDNIRHQVYSFSVPKVFELKLYSGTPSLPVVFDKPGLVIMGCNIHDQMVGFVQVVDTPWFGKSGADGVARIDGVPNEDVVVHVWHWRSGDASETVRGLRMTPDAKLRLVLEQKS